MTQVTNLDIEKYLQYILRSNKLLVIHKWSRKHSNKDSITKGEGTEGEKERHIYVQLHLLKTTLITGHVTQW